MTYVTLDAFYPVVVARRVGPVNDRAVEKLLHWFDVQLGRTEQPISVVYDAGERPDGGPDARARSIGGEWLRRRQKEIRRGCVGIDFAFPSPLSRGALTAVFWIAKPPVPYAMHATCAAAVERAIARVKLTGTMNAPVVVSAVLDLERGA